MLIMSIGKLVNLLEKRKVEQKTNKLLILCVELINFYLFLGKKKFLQLLRGVFIRISQARESSKQLPLDLKLEVLFEIVTLKRKPNH